MSHEFPGKSLWYKNRDSLGAVAFGRMTLGRTDIHVLYTPEQSITVYVMLSGIMLNVMQMNVILINLFLVNDSLLIVILLNVILLNVILLYVILLNVTATLN
jgi:hypothetical protein